MTDDDKSKNDGCGALFFIFFAILFLIPSTMLWGWVAAKVWAWFAPAIIPGIMLLTWKQAAMATFLLHVFLPKYPRPDSKKPILHQIIELAVAIVITPLMTLFTAWIISLVVL